MSGSEQTSGLKIRETEWSVRGGTLRKHFEYTGLMGPGAVSVLQIDIDKSRSLLGSDDPHIHFFLHPSPWPDEAEGFVPTQLAAQEHLVDAPFVLARISTNDDGSLLLAPTDRDGVIAFLQVLGMGKPMRLMLMGQEGVLMELPIPNDADFAPSFESYFNL